MISKPFNFKWKMGLWFRHSRWRQLPLAPEALLSPTSICCRKTKLRTIALDVRKRKLCYGFQWRPILGTLIERLLGEHHCKVILKTLNNKKIAARNFSRKGAKAQRLLIHWLCAFAPLREFFFRLFAHAVSCKSQIGGFHSKPLSYAP